MRPDTPEERVIAVRTSRYALSILFAALIVISMQAVIPVVSTTSAPILPDITDGVEPIPTSNMGPGSPAVVYPGESFKVILKPEYSNDNISSGYVFTVMLEDNKIQEYRYTVTIMGSNGEYTVKLPDDVKPGLYDLILKGSSEYVVPRSVWVIKGPLDVISFVHLSDLHFGTGYPNETIGRHKRFSGQILAQLLAPDMIINTGDETDTQSSSQYIESRAYRYAFLYSLPVFLNPGNHDYPNKNFITYYGPATWYRVIGDKILLIALNTREVGVPTWEQLQWVKRLLEEYRDIPIKIVQMHHPVFYYQGELHISYDSPILTNPRKDRSSPLSYYWGSNITAVRYFLRLCEDYNISIVLAGHIHRDQFVKYVSTRTGGTVYFISTTTLSHGTGTYNGLQYIRLDLNKFTLEFPYAPPWFIEFQNYSRTRVYNSIPNTRPDLVPSRSWRFNILDNHYYYGYMVKSNHAYVMYLENNVPNLDLERTILISLPWAGDSVRLKILSSNGGASAEIVDYKIIEDRVYMALNIKLPSNSNIEFAVYNSEDDKPPVVEYSLSIPTPPTLGKKTSLFFKIYDNEWGIKEIKAKMIINGKEKPLALVAYGENTYRIDLTAKGTEPTTITIEITAIDYAEHTATQKFKITFYPPDYTQTTTTTTTIITTTTTTTTTTTQTATTTTTTTTVTTTTTIMTTAKTTATQVTETITLAEGMSPIMIGEIVIIIILLGIIALALLKKR